jgi:hypothetical protein
MNTGMPTNEPATAAGDKIAAVCDRKGPDAPRMEAHLQSIGAAARWYALRDLDDLDVDVCAGRLGRVVFMSASDLLEGIWSGEITYSRWLAAGVTAEFVDSPGTDAAACLATVSQTWDAYGRRQKRRHTAAGLILSVIAIAAAFAVSQF